MLKYGPFFMPTQYTRYHTKNLSKNLYKGKKRLFYSNLFYLRDGQKWGSP